MMIVGQGIQALVATSASAQADVHEYSEQIGESNSLMRTFLTNVYGSDALTAGDQPP